MSSGFLTRYQGKIKAAQIYLASSLTAGLFLHGPGATYVKAANLWTNAGSPVNGGSGTLNGFANPGDLLVDTTNKVLYQNTNTAASPTWTLIDAAGAVLPAGQLGAAGSGTGTFGLVGNVSKQLSAAGIGNGADTSEDTLFTYSLPANTLASAGQGVAIQAWGNVTATSATKTAKLYFGASVTQSLVYTTTQTGNWQMRAKVYKTASNIQIAMIEFDAVGATTSGGVAIVNNGSETDTAAITIKVTGQSSAATANLITANGLVVSSEN